ncbi:hypothetical protein BJX65DRAFT_110977 [Aspergillus insuetus]
MTGNEAPSLGHSSFLHHFYNYTYTMIYASVRRYKTAQTTWIQAKGAVEDSMWPWVGYLVFFFCLYVAATSS